MTHGFKELREELIRLREAVDAATKIDDMIATESSFTEKLRGNFKTILAALQHAATCPFPSGPIKDLSHTIEFKDGLDE